MVSGILGRIKKFKSVDYPEVLVAEVDERRNEIATVQVKDIKQYLVDEYNRSQELYNQNEHLKEELEKAQEVKLKYDATLVTLDEYAKRLEKYEERFQKKDEALNLRKAEADELREEVNNYKIRLSRAAITRDEIKAEVVAATKEQLIRALVSQKGSLSKARIEEVIRECKIDVTLEDSKDANDIGTTEARSAKS